MHWHLDEETDYVPNAYLPLEHWKTDGNENMQIENSFMRMDGIDPTQD